jgi:toxin ParE1/3/4
MSGWTVRLAAAAERDFQKIIEWTLEQFGAAQSRVYAQTLSMALEALGEGPSVAGAKRRDEIVKGLMSLHVARHGRKGRHFILFRAASSDKTIDVLRIPHDSMDLARHVSD